MWLLGFEAPSSSTRRTPRRELYGPDRSYRRRCGPTSSAFPSGGNSSLHDPRSERMTRPLRISHQFWVVQTHQHVLTASWQRARYPWSGGGSQYPRRPQAVSALFGLSGSMLRRICHRAGFSRPFSPHMFGHYIVNTLMESPGCHPILGRSPCRRGNRLECVARWLGHRSPHVTYRHYWTDSHVDLTGAGSVCTSGDSEDAALVGALEAKVQGSRRCASLPWQACPPGGSAMCYEICCKVLYKCKKTQLEG